MVNSRAGRAQTVIKQADQSKTTDITPAADTELVIPLKANTTYIYEMKLYVKSHADEDFRLDMTAPSGATGTRSNGIPSANPSATASILTELTLGTDDTVQILYYTGIVIVGATSGNLSLIWAQQTSGSNGTTVKAGSSLTVLAQ